MAYGVSLDAGNDWLAAFFRTSGYAPFQGPAGLWVQLHSADPAHDGLTAIIAGGHRQRLPAMSAPANGLCTSLADMVWPSAQIVANQTVRFVTLWDALTVGNFWGSRPYAGLLIAGQSFTIHAGDLTYGASIAV